MSKESFSDKFFNSRTARKTTQIGLGVIAVTVVLLCAESVDKASGQSQPTCELIAPARPFPIPTLLAGLINHGQDVVGKRLWIGEADGTTLAMDPNQIVTTGDSPRSQLMPGETMNITQVDPAVCATINGILRDVPAAT